MGLGAAHLLAMRIDGAQPRGGYFHQAMGTIEVQRGKIASRMRRVLLMNMVL